MIRAITVTALLSLLVLVLYLPSAYPPQRFLAQILADHRAIAAFWGEAAAVDLLDAALARQRNVRDVAPLPSAHDAPSTARVDGAVVEEMASVNDRLFNSPYFRAADAMLLLATHRALLALRWAGWLVVFPLAMAADSLVRRRVKALEFASHDPEVFGVLVCGAILTTCVAVIALVLPTSLHPALLPAGPLLAATLSARAIASYHARP